MPMRPRFRLRLLCGATALWLCAATAAQTAPAVPGHGATHTAAGAAERPSDALRYRVLFSITQGGDAGKPNESLDKVARFMNLLAEYGVRPAPGDVAAVVHGKATPVVLSDAGYRSRHAGAANPNLDLIGRLRQAGVSLRVCSQALAAAGIAPDEVDGRVQIDVAALTTLANLQLRGHALIPD